MSKKVPMLDLAVVRAPPDSNVRRFYESKLTSCTPSSTSTISTPASSTITTSSASACSYKTYSNSIISSSSPSTTTSSHYETTNSIRNRQVMTALKQQQQQQSYENSSVNSYYSIRSYGEEGDIIKYQPSQFARRENNDILIGQNIAAFNRFSQQEQEKEKHPTITGNKFNCPPKLKPKSKEIGNTTNTDTNNIDLSISSADHNVPMQKSQKKVTRKKEKIIIPVISGSKPKIGNNITSNNTDKESLKLAWDESKKSIANNNNSTTTTRTPREMVEKLEFDATKALKSGENEKAIDLYQQRLMYARLSFPKFSPAVAKAHIDLACTFTRSNNINDALQHVMKAENILNCDHHHDHSNHSSSPTVAIESIRQVIHCLETGHLENNTVDKLEKVSLLLRGSESDY